MKYLPEPSTFEMNTSGYYGNRYSRCITPYDSLSWLDVVPKYGIQVPDIVDMTHGKSKCKDCNAVYVGYQPVCTKTIVWHKTPGSYHDQRGYHYLYKNHEAECKGNVVWELADKFSEQLEFFSLLNRLRALPDLKSNPIAKFSNNFPPGVAEALSVQILMDDVKEAKFQIERLQNALKQIAEKMNNAGACLSFGF